MFREGKRGAIASAALDTVERAGLAAIGLWLAGEREALVKKSFAVSIVIEGSVILLGLKGRR